MEKNLEAPGAVVLIGVKAEGAGPPTAIRVRRFLKNALRSFGLRCVSVELQQPAPPRASAG